MPTSPSPAGPPPGDPLEQRLSELIDGTLSPADRAALVQQLADSDDLRAALDDYRRVDDLVRSLASEQLPVDWAAFATEHRHRRQLAGRTRSRVLRLWAPLSAVAAVVALSVVTVVFRDGPSTLDRGPQPIVSVQRAGIAASARVTVDVARTLPPDAPVTVGPPTPDRVLVVSVNQHASFNEEDWNAYF